MEIKIESMQHRFRAVQRGKESRHSDESRVNPSRWRYDYLTLSTLSASIRSLIEVIPEAEPGCNALDLGSDTSPYRKLVEMRGFTFTTLDIVPDHGADYVGTAEKTNLPDAMFDLVLCTQVLEHSMNPWEAMREIHRILKPGGFAVLSAPHVWFYHPHPHDHWRFTQEGMVRLCRGCGMDPIRLQAQGGTVLTLFQILNFVLYGVFGRWGAPLYALSNLIAPAADRAFRDELFCHNFACLARRG